ncbi:MAG TPA: hypothetical protein VM427_03190 [Patescibacteria group bacterium]|nr:hypothetical protein [Patescibacteria group bacterium]
MAILTLLGVGIPLWLVAAAGAIGVPALDDWLYTRAADGLFRTGTIQMAMHSAASLGQIVLVQPFMWLSGGDSWAFTLFGLTTALIGIACTYLLARRFVATGAAILVVLLVVALPGFARLSASFMTDVPAYTLEMLSLLLGIRWLQRAGGRLTLVAALGAGLVAVSIREFAIAAPMAILLAAWARSDARSRAFLLVATGILAAGIALILLAASMAERVPPGQPDHSLTFLVPSFTTSSVLLLPAVLLHISRRSTSLTSQHVILGAALVSFGLVLFPYGPFAGNLWTPWGIGEHLLLTGDRGLLFPGRIWQLFEQLASLAAILLAALLIGAGHRNLFGFWTSSGSLKLARRFLRSRRAPLALFVVLYAGQLVAYTQFGPILDRYLYPMIPVAAILLLHGIAKPFGYKKSVALAQSALVWLAASAFLLAANSFAFDVARFRAGNAAVAMGYSTIEVDAGYEWVGLYATGVGNGGAVSYGLTWYADILSSTQPCAVLSGSVLRAEIFFLLDVDRSAYKQFLFFGPSRPLYLYGVRADGCRQPPQALAPD